MISLEPDDVDREIEQGIARERDQRRASMTRGMWIISRYVKLSWRFEQLPALADGADDGAEVVVEKHDRRDLPCAARAALAHRDADVGGLERRHVVHAVAGHRDDLPAACRAARARSFCAGTARAITSTSRRPCVPAVLEALLQLVARDESRVSASSEPDLAGDGARGQRMIARDHDRRGSRPLGRPGPPPPRLRGPGPRSASSPARRRPRSGSPPGQIASSSGARRRR